uniref:Uncharacterized protein n=1 Tax=Avena sativa TaxID=4498 RepID=A0ACD5YKS2_AVESA
MVSATKLEGGYSFHGKNPPLDQSEGVKVHVYRLSTEQHGHDDLKGLACADQGSPSLLDTIILSQWENFSQEGQLAYDVTACKLKVIEGERDFVIQMNDKWNSFLLKEYGNFTHPFGCLKPNSTRSCEELLLCIAEGDKNEPEVVPSTTPPNDGLLLLANEYPVEYGHIFLVPNVINRLSSFWDKRMFELITKVASEVNSTTFRVFFDDGTSIVPNNMLFQACYFANPLPVESASTVPIHDRKARSGIRVYETVDYPLKALLFTSNNRNALANVVREACLALHKDNTAHSLMISNNGRNVFLFPQVKNLVTGCYLSAWECCGYFVYHTKVDFDRASEAEISNKMASFSFEDGAFEDLKNLCCAFADDLVI